MGQSASQAADAAVSLARVRRRDGLALIQAHRASTALHHPWTYPFTDVPGFNAWYAQTLDGSNVALLARARDSGEVAGLFTFSQVVGGCFQSAYLGYHAMAGCEGRGLMTHALRLCVAYAFSELGLHRVEANIQPDNARSLALVKRAGFRHEGYSPRYLRIGGVWRDHERWARLADD
ncbi:N-acetyltransferase [Xanthomonas sp. SS]|uniref:GNAT family N-acetyltransferase n=1 Tax=Xanthomonas sp. SS TaxID=2724122 RepID=UPI0016396A91|nr:GNAT family N-acetyltransferase [Xanthomonas sp. SS]QNH17790.1 N-acetyltransferase [Xanthomonas sp. SS]